MAGSRLRRNAPKTAAFVYAGYKWFEDHTDEVERWSVKAIEHARGKRYEPVVVPVASAARAAARWIRDSKNADTKPSKPALPE
jgi:hypothetical protein